MESKQELINFIGTFNKQPGQYSDEEILEIGRMLKTLPSYLIDWKWLYAYLGITQITLNAYCKRVYRYLQRNPLPPKEQPSECEAYREEYASKYKEREWVNAYRRYIREEVRIDDLKDEIRQATSKLAALPPIQVVEKTSLKDQAEAVLLLSDLHIGVECDNYYNKYNTEVAKSRLEKLVEQAKHYCKINGVAKLHVLNLGDLIHGIIHTNARIEQSMDVIQQVMVAAEYVAQFLDQLTGLGIPVDYRSVFDNHSRIIADKTQHIEKEQFSRLIDWYLENRLKDTPIKFMHDNIDGGIGKLKIFDKTLLFAHGHQDNKNASMQNFVGLTREWVDYVCLAHYHNPAVKDYQGCKVFVNGSIVGVEQYAFGRRLFTKPSQKLLIFSLDSENIVDIDIAL